MHDLKSVEFPVIDDDQYSRELASLQLLLMKYQHGLFQTGKRAIIVLEGTDASGKGGVIRRMVKNMDSRGYRVYPIGPPSGDEAARHYLQRFWRRIPRAGQLAVFDRSWYGRVLVERVEGFAKDAEWRRAYDELNSFEKLLLDDGVILIKLFLHIDSDEQKERFVSRYENPEKCWKLTMADLDSRQYWDEYQQAYQDMLSETSTERAPWHLIPANDKLYSRVESLKIILGTLQKNIDLEHVVLMSDTVKKRAKEVLDI
ncbi:MAG: polyphosphate kinase 2 family protein [Spongiibacteraceae bacterium]